MKKIIYIMIIINIIVNIYFITKPDEIYSNKLEVKKDVLKAQTINVLDDYKEDDVYINIDEKDIKTTLNKDSLLNYKPGTYYVNYKVELDEYTSVDNLQKITVVDDVKPVIRCDDETILVNSKYIDNKVSAVDNVDGDITSKITSEGHVDYKKTGTYKITYKVSDSSNNETIKVKKVTVVDEIKDDEDEEDKFWYLDYDNTIINMKYLDNKIYIEGYLNDDIDNLNVLVGKNKFDTNKLDDNIYSTIIDVKNINYGTYDIKLYTDKSFDLESYYEEKYRLVRTKIDDKLVTFIYKKNKVQLKIEKFKYEYDIVIDPGHGGSDIGASINGTTEAYINLKQSLYEKKRFEEHGLKVLLIREDDTYGLTYGSDELPNITKRSLAVGYYGSVSKITYSNHQNSNSNKSLHGWEILVAGELTYEDLLVEHDIANDFNKLYNIDNNKYRMYSKDYDSEIMYNKINGEVYKLKDYYAVNREPFYLYGIKVPIYEHIYLSNSEDYKWYVTKGNYKKVSEIKIKHYVESLNIKYKEVDYEK